MTMTNSYFEKIKADRVVACNDDDLTTHTISSEYELVRTVAQCTGPILINYTGEDYDVVVSNWNSFIKTKNATFIVSEHMFMVDPINSEYYVPHKYHSHSSSMIPNVPKLSQCDIVCRWLGFKDGDVISVDNVRYQVWDEHDENFITDFESVFNKGTV